MTTPSGARLASRVVTMAMLLGGLLTIAPSASADVTSAQIFSDAVIESGGCAVSQPNSGWAAPIVAGQKAHIEDPDGGGMVTGAEDDVTRIYASGFADGSVSQVGSDLKDFHLFSSMVAGGSSDRPNSACTVSASMGFGLRFNFTASGAGWLDVSAMTDTGRFGGASVTVLSYSDSSYPLDAVLRGTAEQRVRIPRAGLYGLIIEVWAEAHSSVETPYFTSAPASGLGSSGRVDGSFTLDGAAPPPAPKPTPAPGQALGPALGSARRFVNIDFRVCRSKLVSVGLTGAVRKQRVRTIQFFVNGHRTITLRNRFPARRVILRHLPPGQVEIRAVVTLRPGKRATVTRSFHTCS